jgi:hypothetical protein
MRDPKDRYRRFLAGSFSLLFFSACMIFDRSTGLGVTVRDAYEGVQDGNVESVPLPKDNVYVTVELCVENPSSADRPIALTDVHLATKGNAQIFPSAVGYNQAEAFSWLLPLAEPVGGKRIVPLFYFFLVLFFFCLCPSLMSRRALVILLSTFNMHCHMFKQSRHAIHA